MAQEPFHVIAAPFSVYIAPTGEAFPAIEDAPAGNWALLGTSGERDQTDDGVTVRHPQTINLYRGQGTGPRKAFRTEEDQVIAFTLVDVALETYRYVLNGNTVTDTAAGGGAAGHRSVKTYRGVECSQFSLLVRGPSPYGDAWNMQYEVPVVIHTGTPEPQFSSKGDPAGLNFEFTALEDPNAATESDRFGVVRAQDAAVV